MWWQQSRQLYVTDAACEISRGIFDEGKRKRESILDSDICCTATIFIYIGASYRKKEEIKRFYSLPFLDT